MPLKAGKKLGPYEILTPIGAGGMGEVYKAKDTRLDRTVAIKVLPSHLSDNTELKQRFEREARAVSSLNHPHICTLHDIGEQEGIDFLVMEYLEGETLADRLKKGALPLEQALRHAVEMADALDKAHRQGVVHRDLKPGNIMITKAGAKLLDFGLAKLRADVSAEPSSVLSALPTEAKPLTEKGSIIGTFQYMAPEQLEGKDADARTDIFAFGAVLYESLTGRKAFEGKSPASLIAAILEHEPKPLSELQPIVPPALGRLVEKCLAKDPDSRWQSASDLADELEWVRQGGSQTEEPAQRVRTGRKRERLAWTLAALAAILAAALAIVYFQPAPASDIAARFEVFPPEGTSFSPDVGASIPTVSPDGRSLAFVADESLWIRPIDELEAMKLPDTEGALSFFWSPDSRSIAFLVPSKLKRIDIAGGLPQTICDVNVNAIRLSGAWNREEVILFTPRNPGELHRITPAGGVSEPVTVLDASYRHMWPQFLPDGRNFLYYVRSDQEENIGTYIGSLEDPGNNRQIHSGSRAVYAHPGYLLFVREETLWAQPFDVRRLKVTGNPIPIATPVGSRGGHGAFSASGNGVLAYRSHTEEIVDSKLVWFDRRGQELETVPAPEGSKNPQLSPDGTRLAVERPNPDTGLRDIWLIDLTNYSPTRFTFEPFDAGSPLWSPDGTRIAFVANRSSVVEKNASGVGEAKTILDVGAADKHLWSWSPDGRSILYQSLMNLWILPLTEEGQPTRRLETDYWDLHGQFSPDGRWVSYTSNETGRYEVYVQPFPPSGGKWQISTGGGGQALWRKDGKELFFIASDRTLMSVPVKSDAATFEFLPPTPLFETRTGGDWGEYDVNPDGQRFLIETDVGEPTTSPIIVVLNWTALLEK